MLHLYSLASIPKMVSSMAEDIAKMGGLKAFQATLRQKIKEAELFSFSQKDSVAKTAAYMSGEDCMVYGLLAAAFAMSIIFLPIAILMLPVLIIGCS
jgi:hypothetical protein